MHGISTGAVGKSIRVTDFAPLGLYEASQLALFGASDGVEDDDQGQLIQGGQPVEAHEPPSQI